MDAKTLTEIVGNAERVEILIAIIDAISVNEIDIIELRILVAKLTRQMPDLDEVVRQKKKHARNLTRSGSSLNDSIRTFNKNAGNLLEEVRYAADEYTGHAYEADLFVSTTIKSMSAYCDDMGDTWCKSSEGMRFREVLGELRDIEIGDPPDVEDHAYELVEVDESPMED